MHFQRPSMLRRVISVSALFLVFVACWLGWQLHSRPSMESLNGRWMPPAPPAAPGEMRVTFLGVSTLLFDDGDTVFVTDGFFSRPDKSRVLFSKVAPNRAIVAAALQRAGVHRLDAVVVLHSHYDHAMDSPEVARLTGARLVGSASTANVGRGWGLPESQLQVVEDGATLQLGRFQLELIRSEHAPTGFTGGEIAAPLVPPARVLAYKEGRSYSLLVRHGTHSVLVQASAGFVPGALAGRHADVVFLGVGALGKQPLDYMARYWQETVGTVGARRVVPVHWDDFTLPLSEPLRPSPRLIDSLDRTFTWLRQRTTESGVDLRLAPAWQRIDPFAD